VSPPVQFAALLILATGLLLALGRWLRVPHSLVLFAGGLASALLPWPFPALRVDPAVVTGLMLPPLLHAAAAAVSVDLLRFALLRGVLAGMAQTLLVALAAAWLAGLLMPGLDPAGCLLIGIAVSVGDIRLVQETGQEKQLPRALRDAFAGQGLGAPVMTLTLFSLAVGALGQGLPEIGAGALRFAWNLLGGAALGFAVGFGMAEIRRRTGMVEADVALSVATPFAAALAAGAAGLAIPSVVIAAALTLSWRAVDRRTGEAISSPEARLVERHVWTELGTITSALLFFLMGRALPEALGSLEEVGWRQVLLLAASLVLLAPVLQAALAFLALFLPGAPAVPGREGEGPVPRWKAAAAAGLAGGRSVIALAIVLGVPASLPQGGGDYPQRDLVLAVVAASVLLSVLLHWASLPPVVRWARLGGEAEAEAETRLAQQAAAEAQARAAAPQDTEAGAEQGRRVLAELRARDAIGDQARRAAEQAVELRAEAQKADRAAGA
jgi:CPA1 family monovalent cation:H+ antiporter